MSAWMPVDCEPMGMMDAGRLKAYGGGAIPVAMSRFGEKQLTGAGFDPVFYVPHGIDTTVFRPPEDRQGLREAMGVDGKFVIFMNAANMDKQRKAFPEQVAAFARLHARHPDMLLASYGAADLVTNCSYGEGFGLPVVEAQACGTPVVVTDCSAMTETGAGGWKVPGEKFYIPQQHSWWVKPSIGAIYRAYEEAYQRGPAYQAKKAAAREHALAYDAERVLAGHWKRELEGSLEAFRPVSKIVEFAGLKWQIDDPRKVFSDSLALSHEAGIDHEVLDRIPDGGVFADVGAHVGHYALRAAAKAAEVIAVEANPDTAARLEHNLGLNGITNVTVHPVAAWDERVRMNLLSPHACARDGSTQVLAAGSDDEGFVDGLPLDDLLGGLDRLDLVKLDVEGADLHALRGMAGTLARLRPVLFIEDHSIYGYYERDELNKLLEKLGVRWHDPCHGYLIAEPEQEENR